MQVCKMVEVHLFVIFFGTIIQAVKNSAFGCTAHCHKGISAKTRT